MLKNITFSIEQVLLEKARQKARKQNKSLNCVFKKWISTYVTGDDILSDYNSFMSQASYANSGKKFSRKELNER